MLDPASDRATTSVIPQELPRSPDDRIGAAIRWRLDSSTRIRTKTRALFSRPENPPKLSQGVTTVIAGNCGIRAAPVRLKGEPPYSRNLLGDSGAFRYLALQDHVDAIADARPPVNLAAIVGDTALRKSHLDRLDRGHNGRDRAYAG